MYRIFGVVCCIFLLLPNVVSTQSPQQIAEALSASTVILELNKRGSSGGHGSGFFIGPGLVATNAHVVDGAVSGTVRVVQQPHPYVIEGLVAIDRNVDLAVVQVAISGVPPLSLADSDKVVRGDVVYTLGNPQDFEGVFSEGRISNIIPTGVPGISNKVLQFTAAISKGSSGGAVVDSNGAVIGIVSLTRPEGQNLNFAVPVNALKRLMETAGAVRPLSGEPTPTAGDNTAKLNLLALAALSAVAFVALQFLPIVKSEKLWYTIAAACGVSVAVAILRGTIPDALSEPLQELYYAKMSEEGLSHMVNCKGCIPTLVMIYAKAISYIMMMCLMIGGIGKYVKGIEIDGFFKTIGVASVIVAAEWIVRYVLGVGI